MQPGDLVLIVRDSGWQNTTNGATSGIGHLVKIKEVFELGGYETRSPTLGKWYVKEEEIELIPKELENEPIEVIRLYCNL